MIEATPRGPVSPPLPLRGCLLSGGDSRRMGRDKALLPHPAGGSWLEYSLTLLGSLELPITVLSRHQHHLERALALAAAQESPPALAPTPDPVPVGSRGEVPDDDPVPAGTVASCRWLTAIAEPPPWEGPLLALHRLMERYPEQRLLLCPVDMPGLDRRSLISLVNASQRHPQRIHLAHDGQRLQPLLGIYPSHTAIRSQLAQCIRGGERRLQRWLDGHTCQPCALEAEALRNLNRQQELDAWVLALERDGRSTWNESGNQGGSPQASQGP